MMKFKIIIGNAIMCDNERFYVIRDINKSLIHQAYAECGASYISESGFTVLGRLGENIHVVNKANILKLIMMRIVSKVSTPPAKTEWKSSL